MNRLTSYLMHILQIYNNKLEKPLDINSEMMERMENIVDSMLKIQQSGPSLKKKAFLQKEGLKRVTLIRYLPEILLI